MVKMKIPWKHNQPHLVFLVVLETVWPQEQLGDCVRSQLLEALQHQVSLSADNRQCQHKYNMQALSTQAYQLPVRQDMPNNDTQICNFNINA